MRLLSTRSESWLHGSFIIKDSLECQSLANGTDTEEPEVG